MISLSKEQVEELHKKMVHSTGGLNGVRDEFLLDSALSAPLQTFDGAELYPSIIAKIARVAYSLICNHPFIDGNKRIGTYVMLVLLELNHIETDLTNNDITHIGIELSDGKMNYDELLAFILDRIK